MSAPEPGTALLQRLQKLLAQLEAADPAAAAPARELLQLVLDLHGAGMDRMLEIVAQARDAQALIERFTADEQINALLLLHDLHPQELEQRVRAAVEQLRPHLAVQGLAIEALELNEGVVKLALRETGSGKPPAAEAVRQQLEQALFSAAPDVTALELSGLPVPTVRVPLESIGRKDHNLHG